MKYTTRFIVESILDKHPNLTNSQIDEIVAKAMNRHVYKINGSLIKSVRDQLGINKNKNATSLVFVYGSLLSDLGNNGLLKNINAQFICNDQVHAKLFTHHWGWPFIELSESGTVKGEIYKVQNNRMYRLDSLEGYQEEYPENSLFIRRKIMTIGSKEVFIYEGGRCLLTREAYHIEDGDWKKAYLEYHERNSGYKF